MFLLLERMAEGKIEVLLHDDGRSINPAFAGNFSLYSFPWKGKITRLGIYKKVIQINRLIMAHTFKLSFSHFQTSQKFMR